MSEQELRRREAQVMLACAHSLRAFAETLPPESEVRRSLGAWHTELAQCGHRRAPRSLTLAVA